MKEKSKKYANASVIDRRELEKKSKEILRMLNEITAGLIRLNNTDAKTVAQKNDLLKKCYNLENYELKTFNQWLKDGLIVKQYEHGWVFYKGKGIVMMYTKEQTRILQTKLFVL